MENKEQQILSEIKAMMATIRQQMEMLDAKMAELQQMSRFEGEEVAPIVLDIDTFDLPVEEIPEEITASDEPSDDLPFDLPVEETPVEEPVEEPVQEAGTESAEETTAETIQESNNPEDKTTDETVVPGSLAVAESSQTPERTMKQYPRIMAALNLNELASDKENGLYLHEALADAMESFLANAEIVEKIASKLYRVHFGYMNMNSVMKVFKDMDLVQKNQSFDMECSMDTSVRLSLVDTFLERMADVEGCRVEEI